MSPADEQLPPDIMRLIEFLMRFLEERKCHPILLLKSDDDECFLKSKDGNLSSPHHLDDH